MLFKNLVVLENFLDEKHLKKRKNKTNVGTGAFIGSNSTLIAPLKIGKNSMIGAGSVITQDVPDNKLALARNRQKNIKKK